jgi:thiol:disulfide interchange protein DsbD
MTPDIVSGFEAYMSGSPVMAYLMAYVSGLVVSLTPCIYPMIPVTVAFIAGQSEGSRIRGLTLSLFYVLGTSLTYTALGSIAALTGQFFGSIQTNPWTFFFMANICILMGLAMLDVFTLSFPQLMSFGAEIPGKATWALL